MNETPTGAHARVGRSRALWMKIAEPRVQRITFFILYLLHAAAGLALLFAEPVPVQYVFGQWPAVVWGVLLVVGGGVGAVAVLPGWNFLERVGIAAIVIGIAMASLLILALVPPGGVAFALWLLVSAWIVVFAYRAWEVRLYLVAPTN